MVAPTVADAATTNVAQFHILNDQDSTTAAEAAKYQIVQMQYNGPSTKTLVDQIHADDPGVIVLMYADPVGEGGFSVGSASNGCVTSAQASAGGPAWQLYDGTTATGTTNMNDTSFDDTCISNAMNQAKSADFDGVFWDQIDAVPTYTTSTSCLNAYGGSDCSIYDNNGVYAGWDSMVYTFLQQVDSYDSSDNMKSIINLSGAEGAPGQAPTAVWDQWNDEVSGAMEESFVGSYLGTSVPYAQWQGELADEQWSEANGKYEMAVHYDPNGNQESLDTYGLASMLLNAGGMTSYSSESESTSLPAATYDFWPEYTAAQTLGAPSGAYTTVTSGGATVYERKFANGIVVVNPTASASASVPLGATYSGTGNEPSSATSVTLPAQSGMILTGASPSTAAATAPPSTPGTTTGSGSKSSGKSSGKSGSGKSGSGKSGSGKSGSGKSGSGKGGGAVTAGHPKSSSLPTLSCTTAVGRKKLTLTCTTKGGRKVPTWLRIHVYHHGLIAKHVSRIRHHHATFDVELSKHRIGRYRLVVSIHAGGKVGKLTQSVRIS